MADSFTANLNLRKPEVGAAHDTWGGVAGLNGDLDLIDAVFLATGLGTSVGLHIGSGKLHAPCGHARPFLCNMSGRARRGIWAESESSAVPALWPHAATSPSMNLRSEG